MAQQGKVLLTATVQLSGEGPISNVATNLADMAAEAAMNIDGQSVRPDEVITKRLWLSEALTIGDGDVYIGEGEITGAMLIATEAIITAGVQIGNGLVTADKLDVAELSAITADLGTITAGSIGVGAGGVDIGDPAAGVSISGNVIRCILAGVTTVSIDGATGIITATKVNLTSDAGSAVNFTSGTINLGTSVTVGGASTLGTINSNASNGLAAFNATVQYRSAGAPSNNPSPSGIVSTANANGTYDLKLEWGAYTQGANLADMLILFWRKDGSAPTINDSSVAFNVNTTGASYYIFEGVNPANTYSFGIAAARRTESGIEIGTIQVPTLGPDWRGVTYGTPNYTANIDGATAATVKAGAAAGGTAAQPGNGVVVNASEQITEINCDYGIVVRSTASSPLVQITNTGISLMSATSGNRITLTQSAITVYKTGTTVAVSITPANGIQIKNNTSDTTPGAYERLSFLNNAGTEVFEIHAPYTGSYTTLKTTSGGNLEITATNTQSAKIQFIGSPTASSIIHYADAHLFVVEAGGAAGDIRGVHKAYDGSYKANTSFTFYAASSSGGSPTKLHTVTFEDGLIVSWTAA